MLCLLELNTKVPVMHRCPRELGSAGSVECHTANLQITPEEVVSS